MSTRNAGEIARDIMALQEVREDFLVNMRVDPDPVIGAYCFAKLFDLEDRIDQLFHEPSAPMRAGKCRICQCSPGKRPCQPDCGLAEPTLCVWCKRMKRAVLGERYGWEASNGRSQRWL